MTKPLFVDMTKPLFVDMTKPLFSVSHLALHSCHHHHPAWQSPPPWPGGAWSPTSFPRGVTTAFLFINPISPCYCIIAFLPSLTSKGGTRASQRTICEFPGQLALLAANTGQSIELLLGRCSAPYWGLRSTLAKISGSARYAALARLRSLLKPQKRGISFLLTCPSNIGFSRFFSRCALYESQYLGSH